MHRILRSGTVVWVEGGVATIERCSWLVRVATGNPEPDSIEDTYRDEECGGKVKSLDGTMDHTTCEYGHDRHTYGTAESLADLAEFEARLRADEEVGLR